MAGRKKKDDEGEIVATVTRAFTVAVEDMKSQFKAFGEKLGQLEDKVDAGFARVDQRFEGVDQRFDAMDRRFDAIDARFEEVDARFEAVDARFDRVDRELALVKDAVLTHDRELREMGRGTR